MEKFLSTEMVCLYDIYTDFIYNIHLIIYIRIINKLSRRTSCGFFFQSGRFLTLTGYYLQECIMFIFMNRHYFSSNLPSHSYNNRNCFYEYPVHRLTRTVRGAKYYCTEYFNQLPLSMRQLEHLNNSKKELNKFP